MKIRLAAVSAVYFLALLSAGIAAPQEPPPVGRSVDFAKPFVFCDTQEQLGSIVAAGRTDPKKAQAMFAELSKAQNEKKEPICAYGVVKGVTILAHVDMGIFVAPPDVRSKATGLHMKDANGIEGWLLYTESLEIEPTPFNPKEIEV